ncbi:MAG: hypothetical protein ACRD2W_21035, partial [Acidimicrobiales bacterium]
AEGAVVGAGVGAGAAVTGGADRVVGTGTVVVVMVVTGAVALAARRAVFASPMARTADPVAS